jgi:hypothetical protein
MRYSVDTSSIVKGFRELFAYEIHPTFWNRDLPALVASGDLRATEEVLIELRVQDDEILAWTDDLPDLFVEVDVPIQHKVREILRDHPRLIHAGRSGACSKILQRRKAQMGGENLRWRNTPNPNCGL